MAHLHNTFRETRKRLDDGPMGGRKVRSASVGRRVVLRWGRTEALLREWKNCVAGGGGRFDRSERARDCFLSGNLTVMGEEGA